MIDWLIDDFEYVLFNFFLCIICCIFFQGVSLFVIDYFEYWFGFFVVWCDCLEFLDLCYDFWDISWIYIVDFDMCVWCLVG